MASARQTMNILAGLSLGPTVSAKRNKSANTEAITIDQAHRMPELDSAQAPPNILPDQAPADLDDLAPYSTRIRVIFGLSLLAWLLVAVAVLWLIRAF